MHQTAQANRYANNFSLAIPGLGNTSGVGNA